MIALKIILAVFLLLLLAARRSYPWVIAATIPIYAWLSWIINRPLPSTDDWGSIDRAIISIALFIGITPALGRFLLDARKSDMALSRLDWKPVQVSCLFVAIWAGAWFLTPTIPRIIGAATSTLIALLLSLVMFGAMKRSRENRALFATVGAALITGTAAVLIWPAAIVVAAEQRASGQAYCLVVANGSNYRNAEDLIDLTPLIMRGREGGKSALNFHGEMILGGSRRNWSYRNFDFADKARDNKPPHCITEIGFARNLPWF